MTRPSAVHESERRRAVGRALELLYLLARRDSVFNAYDGHLLLAFALIGTTSRDASIRKRAVEMGRERIRHWVRCWRRIRKRLTADTVLQQVVAADAAARLGMPADRISSELRALIADCSTAALVWFDPSTEDIPGDIPEDCACGRVNARGCRSCRRCRKRLQARSRYEIFYYALTSAYFCQRQSMPLRARVADVIAQLARLRPYPQPGDTNHYQAIYAATHTVYVLNDYGRSLVPASHLHAEKAFLSSSMSWALDAQEPDTIGEIVDSLLALGVPDAHRLIAAGRAFLLRTQQADGGWGGEDDDYGRFHTVWTAIDGLRDHRWRAA